MLLIVEMKFAFIIRYHANFTINTKFIDNLVEKIGKEIILGVV